MAEIRSNKKTKKKKPPVRTGILGNAIDYRFYKMNIKEIFIGFTIGFVSTALVFFIFFRYIPLSVAAGIIAGIVSINYYKKYLISKRKERLLAGFKQLLEELSTSYSAGSNTYKAFQEAYEGLRGSLGERSEITNEVRIILQGIRNNYNIELLIRDFADRSDLEDVRSFADVFEMAYRMGGDFKKIVSDTREVLCDKIDMERRIQGALSSGKQELYIMMVMPLVVTLSLNVDSSMSIASNSFVFLITKIGALALFVVAFLIGSRIIKIRV